MLTVIAGTAQTDTLANFRAIDINSNGLQDLMYTRGGTWHFMLSTGLGMQADVNTSISSASGAFLVVDYDSDGRDHLLRQDGTNWRIYRSNGSTLPPSYSDSLSTLASNTPFAVDITGDGLPDIVQNYGGRPIIIVGRFGVAIEPVVRPLPAAIGEALRPAPAPEG